VLITKRVEFSASHVCRNEELSDSENNRIYGPAANPKGHGHNYVLDVTLEGSPNPVTGMVLDLKELKDILQRAVLDPLDHRFLNYEVAPFDRMVPTLENIAIEIWKRLETAIPPGPVRLQGIRVHETRDLYVEYFGDSR
jgi:6-pyruvoyltetrahydropterin/6-carboxytetrahydropterin synthase